MSFKLRGHVEVFVLFLLTSTAAVTGCSSNGQDHHKGDCQAAFKATRYSLLPKGPSPADIVDVVDLCDADLDTKLAATTLQGLVNRGRQSRVYVNLINDPNNTPSSFWLDYFKEKGHIKDSRHLSIDDYFRNYSSAYNKVIVYDPNLPATINVGTMIGSLEDGIVSSPSQIDKLGQGKQLVDLRGRWKTNVEAYEWAWENLWPKMRQDVLATYHPTFSQHYLRDYLIANKIFTFWVTGEHSQDGIISDHLAEKGFAEKVYRATPPNICLIGWNGNPVDEGMSEYGSVGFSGRFGKVTVCSNWLCNMTLVSGIDVDIPAMVTRYQSRGQAKPVSIEADKVYLCFAVQESGDAPMYWPAVQEKVWADPRRGDFPVGWCVGLMCYEWMPAVMEWFYDNATSNDHFYIAISGIGYNHPYRDFMKDVADRQQAWKEHLDVVQDYIDLLDIHQMGIYTDAWLPFDRRKNDPVTLKYADGLSGIDTLIMGMGRDEGIVELGHNYLLGKNNVLVSHVVTRWDATNVGRNDGNIQWLVQDIRNNTPKERPAFVYVHPLSWSYWPTELAAVLDQLGDEYVPVSPTQLHQLYMQARQD